MDQSITVNGVELKPLLTHHQAQNQLFVHGEDEKGPYVACQLSNRFDSPFYRWYVFVSPEDLPLMREYRWCGNVCGGRSKTRQGVEIRRREVVDGKLYSIQLRRDIWERMGGPEVPHLQILGHPLDFRRENIAIGPRRFGRNKGPARNCRGITRHKNRWQVQIQIKGHSFYLGRVKNPEDGYRIYNRYLRALKTQFPKDRALQRAPYNDIDPMF